MINILKELEEIKAQLNRISNPTREFLTLEEAKEYLQISKSYLYKMTSNREIPFYCPGGKIIFFKRTDLDLWISNGKIDSNEEVLKGVGNYLNRTKIC